MFDLLFRLREDPSRTVRLSRSKSHRSLPLTPVPTTSPSPQPKPSPRPLPRASSPCTASARSSPPSRRTSPPAPPPPPVRRTRRTRSACARWAASSNCCRERCSTTCCRARLTCSSGCVAPPLLSLSLKMHEAVGEHAHDHLTPARPAPPAGPQRRLGARPPPHGAPRARERARHAAGRCAARRARRRARERPEEPLGVLCRQAGAVSRRRDGSIVGILTAHDKMTLLLAIAQG